MGHTADDAVMHFELTHGRTACGRKLPTRGFTTDDIGIMESREGTRCKSCWRVVKADHVATEREFDKPEARARRERERSREMAEWNNCGWTELERAGRRH